MQGWWERYTEKMRQKELARPAMPTVGLIFMVLAPSVLLFVLLGYGRLVFMMMFTTLPAPFPFDVALCVAFGFMTLGMMLFGSMVYVVGADLRKKEHCNSSDQYKKHFNLRVTFWIFGMVCIMIGGGICFYVRHFCIANVT
jgi:hypothetical protein